MFRQTLHRGLTLVCLGAGLVAGCKSATKEESYPPDPLLMSRKPIEGTVVTGPNGELLVSADPVEPHMPPLAYAANAQPAPPPIVTATPIPGHRGPLVATPAVRTKPVPDAVPFAGRKVQGTYGHAADYSWLQGVLDRHYHGHLDLRYCDATVEDTFGGKVCLESDPRLAQFQEGDTIVVEGMLLPANNQAAQGNLKSYPHYRVYNVWLVQRKN